jgi:hypothetical protein
MYSDMSRRTMASWGEGVRGMRMSFGYEKISRSRCHQRHHQQPQFHVLPSSLRQTDPTAKSNLHHKNTHLAAVVVVCQGPHQLRLPDPRRPDEEQRRDGAVGVAEAAAGAGQGGRDGVAGVVLADDAALEGLALRWVGWVSIVLFVGRLSVGWSAGGRGAERP